MASIGNKFFACLSLINLSSSSAAIIFPSINKIIEFDGTYYDRETPENKKRERERDRSINENNIEVPLPLYPIL